MWIIVCLFKNTTKSIEKYTGFTVLNVQLKSYTADDHAF